MVHIVKTGINPCEMKHESHVSGVQALVALVARGWYSLCPTPVQVLTTGAAVCLSVVRPQFGPRWV